MGEKTHIEWTDHTFNPWIGCTKVSPGCANCYAEARDKRFAGGVHWGKGAPRLRTSESNWRLPRKWHARLETLNQNIRLKDNERVFCASLADVFDKEAPAEWLADLFFLISQTHYLNWLLLTKRPGDVRWLMERAARVENHLGASAIASLLYNWDNGHLFPNTIWIGTTVEDQQRADERIPELLKIPARIRFLSCEPLLEEIDLATPCFNGADSFGSMPGIHWVIFGGESGGRACNIEWLYSGLQQCQRAGVKCFVKQLGSNAQTGNANLYDWPDSTRLVESCCIEGAAAGIRTVSRKGGDWDEWPEQLRVREFPL